jgi:hypothetical protein
MKKHMHRCLFSQEATNMAITKWAFSSARQRGALLAAALLCALLLGACATTGNPPDVKVRGQYDIAIGGTGRS